MRKLFPILLALIGTGAGVGAGLFFQPDPPAIGEAAPAAEDEKQDPANDDGKPEESADREYVKINNQFVIPVVGPKRVNALVVLSLSLDVAAGQSSQVYSKEPKLRDEFLQVLFDHANIGGFDGSFTQADRMDILRNALLEAAQSVLDDVVKDVLITEIGRQDS